MIHILQTVKLNNIKQKLYIMTIFNNILLNYLYLYNDNIFRTNIVHMNQIHTTIN